jgi:hypothetical protein
MTAAERDAEIERLAHRLNAIDLETYIERRQVDRLLERVGVRVKPTPRPRFRQAPVRSTVEASCASLRLSDAYADPGFQRWQAQAAARGRIARPGTGETTAARRPWCGWPRRSLGLCAMRSSSMWTGIRSFVEPAQLTTSRSAAMLRPLAAGETTKRQPSP